MKKTNKGFTLIELLVVIAIIGLLATLSVIALNNARERARDSRRVSDIKQIQTALELYFNANDEYPIVASKDDAHTLLTGEIDDFLNPVPQNPSPDDCNVIWEDYQYVSTGAGAGYELDYCLGNDTGGIDAGANTATEMTVAQ